MTPPFVAALPMYDFASTAQANDALWSAMARRLRDAGIDAPLELTRGAPPGEIWRSPRLLFGQACGYPWVRSLRGVASLLAAPRYGLPGCAGAEHCAFFIAPRRLAAERLGAFRGLRAACNARDSNTGMNLLRHAIAPLAEGGRFFSHVLETGSHRESLRAVGEGRAELASVDCVSYGLLQVGEPGLAAGVAIVGRSAASPGLPFIASSLLSPAVRDAVRAALAGAMAEPTLAPARAALGLAGIEAAREADYERVAAFEDEAVALGYPVLA